jgi:hypothetical protein
MRPERRQALSILLFMPRGVLYQRNRGFRKNLRRSPPPESLNARIRIVDEGVEEVDYRRASADLVGITCITGTATRAYGIADAFRERGTPVVLRGPHPTLMSEEAKTHADTVIVGLPNRSWQELLKDFLSGVMHPFYCDPDATVVHMPFARGDLVHRTADFLGDGLTEVARASGLS